MSRTLVVLSLLGALLPLCSVGAAVVPSCRGILATIYVESGRVVGGPLDGKIYRGKIRGTARDDVIVGTEQRDRITARRGDDLVCAEGGDDVVIASKGFDILDGGAGDDKLKGGSGADYCVDGRGSKCEPPTAYIPYQPLMKRMTFLGPLFSTGSAAVKRRALEEAETLMAMMLRHRPDVTERLQQVGAVTAVFSGSESVCDLDYFADLSGQDVCQSAAGGLGGVPGRPATACAQLNLLRDPADPFGRGTRPDGENVCVHELAHTIMNVGLPEGERSMLGERFRAARDEGRWTGDFSMTNADEFFAEMSQSYFCANPNIPTFLHVRGVNCAGDLRNYDEATYELLDSIYRGAADLR